MQKNVYNKLSSDQLTELKEMALNSKAPVEIADYFGIGVATVHNYKRKMRAEGVIFPDMRGIRPDNSGTSMNSPFKIIIGDKTFVVPAEAKEIIIKRDTIEVKF